ncbi:Pr6Pr family membrane protein [Belliella pelovolcani]|uniref:Pr6Pr family membrane protein n=1 Tax=Belliella pelovolcani TaxID=529505 RepID=UPI00391C8558
MKKNLSILFALIGWFAVISQLYLALQNRATPIPEALVRFFSYFTILTNTLVASYFTAQTTTNDKISFFKRKGSLSAITVYILVVGIVYQVALRSIWNPEGLQKITDELLHTVIPILTLVYWYLYEKKNQLTWQLVPAWLTYPVVYLVYIMIRGHFSGFYPYPFVNVAEIGYGQTVINSLGVLLLFVVLSSGMILIKRIF